ncbi:MAG TPA: TetR/AcrR family transcriptional regulator [Rhizomicrobium sp.]|nr:TetR/AcrR family transcriptional regulator [Rhizomicrobium sp.]
MALAAPRWKRRKTARPQEILDAALACFAERGFAATRMDDIAARAGVTKGTIYLYFENKEAVFKTLARESIVLRLSEVRESMQHFDGRTADLLRFVITAMNDFIATSDRVVLPKVLLAEVGNFPDLAKFWREEIIDRGLGLFASVIERGIARGEFRKLDPQHVARLCIAPMLVSIFWRTTFAQFDRTPFDYQKFIDTHLDILLRGLEAGERAKP